MSTRSARGGPFGRTIAHGYLSLSLVPSLLFECLQVTGARLTVNYGANRVRFPAPAPVGEREHLAAPEARRETEGHDRRLFHVLNPPPSPLRPPDRLLVEVTRP